MRVAVLDRNRCQPKRCQLECIRYCPVNRTGKKAIEFLGDFPFIYEDVCIGCGICVKKCPFGAIHIENLPDELGREIVHSYGPNAFRLFGLPVPVEGSVVGILGRNGTGKSTAMSILAGLLVPNFGSGEGDRERVVRRYARTRLGAYFKGLYDGSLRVSLKPQFIEAIPRAVRGRVGEVLSRVDRSGMLERVSELLGISHLMDRSMETLSGGELQKVAIAAAILRDPDILILDEPTSYLDIRERMRIATLVRDLGGPRFKVVVEHDLAVLDYLADYVHIFYGKGGVYGIVSEPKVVRVGINEYLNGMLKAENVRIRDKPVTFFAHPPRRRVEGGASISWTRLVKGFESFTLTVEPGRAYKGEIVGVVGPNATGKTTFMRILGGRLEPDEGGVSAELGVRLKPQYVDVPFEGSVSEFLEEAGVDWADEVFKLEVFNRLELERLLDLGFPSLSGGEKQLVLVAACLGAASDVYLLDEPTAYLDVEMRMMVARAIRESTLKRGSATFVVDHDIYFIDLVSDALMVFEGEPGVRGTASGPYPMREGMNRFLRGMGITFRRDPSTGRPRINKLGSRMDEIQKRRGEYYY